MPNITYSAIFQVSSIAVHDLALYCNKKMLIVNAKRKNIIHKYT